MMEISVSFTFEAENMAAAQEAVATWTVHPGVKLLGLSGTEHGIAKPVVLPAGGTIGGHLLVTAQHSYADELPPPVQRSPGGPERPQALPGPVYTPAPPLEDTPDG